MVCKVSLESPEKSGFFIVHFSVKSRLFPIKLLGDGALSLSAVPSHSFGET
jgi:hypothetical protein